jgi:GTP-binding protein HflX
LNENKKRTGRAATRKQSIDRSQRATRAIVVSTLLKSPRDAGEGVSPRSAESKLAEAVGLASAIGLDIRATLQFNIAAMRPATLIGTGKVDEIAQLVRVHEAELVIVDHALSPVQQRNLEKAFSAKVIDRTGLILEIFGERARTREGTLQVELAHLEYQRGRLVRSWTHLERQRGGGGFLGGPGETQIEADRRLLQERILRIRRELEDVKRTRALQRAKRKKVPYPVVAIVGYTNAGKSTLFNRLTGAGVTAADMLFATLDPTLRRIRLPHGTEVMLSDTVGFVSELPTHLVAAFRATLEEVLESDLILHVRDISDADSEAQAEDVGKVLLSLGVDMSGGKTILEVWNKIDRLDAVSRDIVHGKAARLAAHGPALVSAVTGEGTAQLLRAIETRVAGASHRVSVHLAADKLARLSWIYGHAEVVGRTDNEDGSVDLDLIAPLAAQDAIRRMES